MDAAGNNNYIPKIKLCGMMREADIDYVNEVLPDYAGFIFADTRRRITHEAARKFRLKLDGRVKAVGVFVDGDTETVAGLLNEGVIDMAQLHGNEDRDYISGLRKLTDKPLIKAVKVTCASDIEKAALLDVDFILLDTYRKGVLGGTGESFNWDIINKAAAREGCTIGGKPFFLAGGLNRDNISKAADVGAYGLDISSGIEKNGYKDRELIIDVVSRIRKRT